MFRRVGLVQIDSVNVLVRSQELPLFARLGPHPRSLIPDATHAGLVFEYWGHEASHIPVEHHRLFRWRMEAAANGEVWNGLRELQASRPAFVEEVYARVRDGGAVVARDVGGPRQRKGPWWDWDGAKAALELLFWTGRVTARRRPNDFARVYDLTERMIPAAALAAATPSQDEARRELVLLAAGHLGVATLGDLADYHRQNVVAVRPRLRELVEQGRLLAVSVEGWRQPAFVLPDAVAPRRVNARALLSPFDSLVWERSRAERLFGFHYRLELYTPAALRRYGYYVLPFLLGDRLVARVDVKSDRARRVLIVHAAYGEAGVAAPAIAGDVAAELASMAAWLGLERVEVGSRGDLAGDLARAIRPVVPCPGPSLVR